MPCKEDDNYPNPFWSFYSHRQPVRVTLSRETPEVDSIQLVLEPKAGVIIGTVSDAVSGEPVSASIHMWRANNERDFLDLGVSGQYRILVPADTVVRFSVRVPGYVEWLSGEMILPGGRSQTLLIKLTRAAQ